MDLIFLGTGVSTAIPVMGHMSKGCACYDAINTPNSKNMRNNVSILLRKKPTEEELKAIGDPPTNSLHNSEWQRQRAAVETNILFDCGKTFRAAYFNVLAKMGVSVISALLLTHEHADAAAGLDDLRDLVPIMNTGPALEVYQAIRPCPTYMTLFTLNSLCRTVGYILKYSRFLNAERKEGLPYAHADSPSVVADYAFNTAKRGLPATAAEYGALIESTPLLGTTQRRVTSLDVLVLPESVQQFYVEKLAFPVISFPVFHGGDYICTAYAFGSALQRMSDNGGVPTPLQAEAIAKTAAEEGAYAAAAASGAPPTHFLQKTHRSIVYMSDVSSIGADSMAFLADLGPVDLLIVDLLLGPNEKHFSHWCFDDVVAFTKVLRPRGVLGFGMWCTIEHAAMNTLLEETLAAMKREDPTLRTEYMGLAYDGLHLRIE